MPILVNVTELNVSLAKFWCRVLRRIPLEVHDMIGILQSSARRSADRGMFELHWNRGESATSVVIP
jgi:hypothetical protein